MFVWGFRVSPRSHPVRKVLIAAGILILVESLLGAGLVLFELVADNSSVIRAIVVALHLANTFLLVASLALTAYWASGGAPVDIVSNQRPAMILGAGLLGMLLIGMSGAVTALGDTLFPAGSLVEGIAQDLDSSAHFLIQLRVYHPLIALAIAIYSLQVVRTLYSKNQAFARRMLIALLSVGGFQILVGTINLLLLAPIPMQLIHLFTAESVWITYVLTSAAILAH